jgi:hypothetical protein
MYLIWVRRPKWSIRASYASTHQTFLGSRHQHSPKFTGKTLFGPWCTSLPILDKDSWPVLFFTVVGTVWSRFISKVQYPSQVYA